MISPTQNNDIITYLLKRFEVIHNKIQQIEKDIIIELDNKPMTYLLTQKYRTIALRDEITAIYRELEYVITPEILYEFCMNNLEAILRYYGIQNTVAVVFRRLNTADKIMWTDAFAKLHYSFNRGIL